jgi:hypothetical protein
VLAWVELTLWASLGDDGGCDDQDDGGVEEGMESPVMRDDTSLLLCRWMVSMRRRGRGPISAERVLLLPWRGVCAGAGNREAASEPEAHAQHHRLHGTPHVHNN